MKPVKSFDNFLKENKLTSNKPKLNEISPSRVKYEIGDKVKVRKGRYEGKEGVIRTTYAKKHNSSDGKDQFEIYFPHLKDTVSWFKPTDLEKIEMVKEAYDITKELRKGKIVQAADGGELYKVISVTPTQVTLIDLEDEIEEIFPDDYKSNPKDDSPSIEDFWGYYSDLDSEHKKKLKSLK